MSSLKSASSRASLPEALVLAAIKMLLSLGLKRNRSTGFGWAAYKQLAAQAETNLVSPSQPKTNMLKTSHGGTNRIGCKGTLSAAQ